MGLGRRDWVWGALYGGNGIILTPGILLVIIDALVILCAQLTRDLFAIAKFLLVSGISTLSEMIMHIQTFLVPSLLLTLFAFKKLQ